MSNLTINRSLPVLTIILFTAAMNLFIAGQTAVAQTQCTAPYMQVQGAAAAFFPDPTMQFSIERVNIGEPFVNCSTKQLTVILKVVTMDPGTGSAQPPPNGIWRVLFTVPPDANSTGTFRTVFVVFDTAFAGPIGEFQYGWVDEEDGFDVYQNDNPLVTGTVAADGTITMNWNLTNGATFGPPTGGTAAPWNISAAQWAQGVQLTSIQGETARFVGTPVIGGSLVDAQTAGDGVYTVQGNLSCSLPPVAALMATPTSGPPPLMVNFDASGSNIPAGGCGTIDMYIFDFGDGTAQVTQSTPTISHTYTMGGTYQARVRVTSTAGLTSSNIAQVNIDVNSGGPPIVTSIVSRKTHGAAGDFDILLPQPPASRNIECRSGGAGGNYKLVFTFLHNVSSVTAAAVTTGTGSVANRMVGPNSNQYTVDLTGVTTGQSTTVLLTGVLDDSGALGNIPAIIGVLVGDASNNASVNSSDISLTKGRSGQAVTTSNFRSDVNASGSINSSDIATVKGQSGMGLP